MSHTPTPWETGDNEVEVYQAAIIFDKDGIGLANCEQYEIHRSREECEANAAFIIEACNAYERLKKERDALLKAATYACGKGELDADAELRKAIAFCKKGGK